MRLTLSLLGHTLDVNLTADATSPAPDEDSRGEATSYPVGFVASPGDQRWDRTAELE